jgi:uncharacterized membrane-anchored protein
MSSSRARPARIFAQAWLLLTVNAVFGVAMSEAGEGRRDRSDDNIIERLPPLSRERFDEIVTQLPPLQPVKKRAASDPVEAAQSASQTQTQQPLASTEKSEPQPLSESPQSSAGQPAAEARQAPMQIETSAAPSSAQTHARAAAISLAPATASEAAPIPLTKAPGPGRSAEQSGSAAAVPAPLNLGDVAQGQSAAGSPLSGGPVSEAAQEPAAPAPAAAEGAGRASLDVAARAAAIIDGGVKGPATVHIAGRGAYSAPEGRIFLPKEKARELVEAAGRQWDEATVGVILGASSGLDWLAFVDLVDDGYIRDSDAIDLDQAKLLDAHKASVAANNEVRSRAGAKPLTVTGWADPPRYDETHRFVSCIGATVEPASDPHNGFVNCTSYALGRDGAFKIIVATSRDGYEALKGEASRIAGNIVYDPGRGYADVNFATDRIAPYGLVALASGALGSNRPVGKRIEAVDVRRGGSAAGAWFDYVALALAGLTGAGLLAHRFRRSAAGAARDDDPVREAAGAGQKKAPAWAGVAARLKAKIVGAPAAAEAQSEVEDLEELALQRSTTSPDAEEGHASVLSRLAVLMRKNAPEPTPTVNIDRWTRRRQMKNGAVTPGAAPQVSQSDARAPLGEGVEVGLIEPGDASAASKAMKAQRAPIAASA